MQVKYAALVASTDGEGNDQDQKFHFYRIHYPVWAVTRTGDLPAETVITSYLANGRVQNDWRDSAFVETVIPEGSAAFKQLAIGEPEWVDIEAWKHLENET